MVRVRVSIFEKTDEILKKHAIEKGNAPSEQLVEPGELKLRYQKDQGDAAAGQDAAGAGGAGDQGAHDTLAPNGSASDDSG